MEESARQLKRDFLCLTVRDMKGYLQITVLQLLHWLQIGWRRGVDMRGGGEEEDDEEEEISHEDMRNREDGKIKEEDKRERWR